MIEGRFFPQGWSELAEGVRLATRDSRSVAVQAGHFLLHYDEEERRLLPCVSSELVGRRHDEIRREVSQFPELSWQLALGLVKAMQWPQACVLVIVNDVQYIPSMLDRHAFYEAFPQLPAAYLEMARDFGLEDLPFLTPSGLARLDAQRPYFSERWLRNRYGRAVKKLLKSDHLPAGMAFEDGAAGATCLVDAMGANHKLYCASEDADCSQEIAQLVGEIHDLARCDTFVNLYPGICREFVERGSELSFSLYPSSVSKIVNIGLPATGVASVDELIEEAEVAIHLNEASIGPA
jgi:hypothetical protein